MLSQLDTLSLDGLVTITDAQAEFFGKIKFLSLTGLTSITDKQAESLSKVEFLEVSEALQPFINTVSTEYKTIRYKTIRAIPWTESQSY